MMKRVFTERHDNDCRSDRTRAGMKAALELGRWVFLAPLGYLNAPRAMGKSLMADPERAPLVRRAFEEYATARFTKEQLLKKARTWGLTNRRGHRSHRRRLALLPRNQLHAGIVDVPEYSLRRRRGDFKPLISEAGPAAAGGAVGSRASTPPPFCEDPDVSADGVWQRRTRSRISGIAQTPPLALRRRTPQ